MFIDFPVGLHVCVIIVIGTWLFLAVHELEHKRRLAVVFKCAILVAGGAAIIKQLT